MKITIDENKIITGYTTVGDIEGSIEYNDKLPDGFKTNFKPSFYLLKNDEIIENPDYVEPSDIPSVIGPSKQDKINAQIMLSQAKQKEEQDKFNAQILLKLAGGMK